MKPKTEEGERLLVDDALLRVKEAPRYIQSHPHKKCALISRSASLHKLREYLPSPLRSAKYKSTIMANII